MPLDVHVSPSICEQMRETYPRIGPRGIVAMLAESRPLTISEAQSRGVQCKGALDAYYLTKDGKGVFIVKERPASMRLPHESPQVVMRWQSTTKG